MIVLGLNYGHADSSACLLKDSTLLAAISEERLGNRVKHDNSFPTNAIKFVLDYNEITLDQIDVIAVGRDPNANMKAKMFHVVRNPISGMKAVKENLRRRSETNLFEKVNSIFTNQELSDKCRIRYFEHHVCHIASAYFVGSSGEEALGFSMDGSGDFVSCMLAKCSGQKIDILEKVHLPHSIGFFYTAMCQFIGFDKFGEEYKVMGLAPYGNDNYSAEMAKIVEVNGTQLRLNDRYIEMHSGGSSEAKLEDGSPSMNQIYKKQMEKLFGPARDRNTPISQREKDIARSTQVMFENIVCTILSNALKKYDLSSVYMAGGCSLNGVCNARIDLQLPVDKQFIQPAASDDGIAVGAAFLALAECGKINYRVNNKSPYLGGDYTDDQIRAALQAVDNEFMFWEHIETEEKTISLAADDIATSKVIGWFQGRSEWGPRALGNRSILADPSNPNMKDIINQKIKKRESFRPFAPSVLAEDVKEYFVNEIESPYMMHVIKFKQSVGSKLPAVTHVDGSGRLQSVSNEMNPRYHRLISEVKKRTGWGVVLNTSFNENEPVVEKPAEAISCFLRTDMDVLYLNKFRVTKR